MIKLKYLCILGYFKILINIAESAYTDFGKKNMVTSETQDFLRLTRNRTIDIPKCW